jgi:hypothetical protein
LLLGELRDAMQERLMKRTICLRGAFKVLEADPPLAGKISALLLVQERCARINDVVLGLVLGDGSFRVLSLGLQLTDAILKPGVRTARRLVF